jgi:CheY-like chemotaxis protein
VNESGLRAFPYANKADQPRTGVMTEFQKVLVVDDGARNAENALSAELAGLGFASVTTSVEATDEVLEMIPAPTAILIQLPRRSGGTKLKQLMDLAERLKAKKDMSGIPIIVVEAPFGVSGGGYGAMLQNELGVGALNKPER